MKPARKPFNKKKTFRKPMNRFIRRKSCRFCVAKATHVDYKNANILRSFITDRGKMISARTTGTCAGHQRMLTTAIHRARNLALLPYSIM